MTTTTNKALALPTVGGESGTWGTDLNNNTIALVDLMLGGVVSISLSASNYSLTSSDIQNVIVKLSGVLLTNVIVRSSCIGFYIVENNCTGNFTVTWQGNYGSGDTGSAIVIGQGSRNFFVADSTSGVRRADTTLFPMGTTLSFFQASAPTGWTQVTSYNDYAMRIVSGTGGVNHAGSGFLAGSTDGHTLVTGEIPSHNHGVTDPGHTHPLTENVFASTNAGLAANSSLATNNVLYNTTSARSSQSAVTGISIQNSGGGGSHSHTLSGLSVLDFIICSKN